ncbi:MAG: DUF1553 domain-containing protein, partial [Planctomycetota bacterium]
SSPLAALVQLNNPQTVEAARSLAGRILEMELENPEAVAGTLFRILTSRKPSAKERRIVANLYQQQFEYFQKDPEATEAFLSIGQLNSTQEKRTELAAWASVANTLFSFDECVVKR